MSIREGFLEEASSKLRSEKLSRCYYIKWMVDRMETRKTKYSETHKNSSKARGEKTEGCRG